MTGHREVLGSYSDWPKEAHGSAGLARFGMGLALDMYLTRLFLGKKHQHLSTHFDFA